MHGPTKHVVALPVTFSDAGSTPAASTNSVFVMFPIQAEIAGGAWKSNPGLPRKGDRIPDFEAHDAGGKLLSTSQFRGRVNLVLVFVSELEKSPLVEEMAARYGEFKAESAELIIVARAINTQIDLPYLVRDAHGAICDRFAAGSDAVFITDRFGEIFAIYRKPQVPSLPSVDAVLQWLEFINRQCPECGTPEWPI
jgi:hypothetical protein